MVNPSLADETPEKRYEKELLFHFHSCLLKARGCETALEHAALGFKAARMTFQKWSIVALCFVRVALVLFCCGCITLLPLPLIHPVYSFSFRGTLYPLLCTGSWGMRWLKGSALLRRERPREKDKGRGATSGYAGCTASPGWWGA